MRPGGRIFTLRQEAAATKVRVADCSSMSQVFKMDRPVFKEAASFAAAAESVATAPMPVAVVQPKAQPLPAWYHTPVVIVPIAAAAFIVGNVLMMIPWQVL
jgi:hypothetical protein